MKQKMIRILSVLLCLTLIGLVLSGCGKSSEKGSAEKGKNEGKKETEINTQKKEKESETLEKEEKAQDSNNSSPENPSSSQKSDKSGATNTTNPGITPAESSNTGSAGSSTGGNLPTQKKNATLNGIPVEIGKKISIEVILKTKDVNTDPISVNVCFRMFQNVNGQLQPTHNWIYNDWLNDNYSDFDDFHTDRNLAMHETHGGPLEEEEGNDLVLYGFWYEMANFEIEGYKPVTDFSSGRAICRFHITLPEAGEFVVRVNDEHWGLEGASDYTNSLSLNIYQ